MKIATTVNEIIRLRNNCVQNYRVHGAVFYNNIQSIFAKRDALFVNFYKRGLNVDYTFEDIFYLSLAIPEHEDIHMAVFNLLKSQFELKMLTAEAGRTKMTPSTFGYFAGKGIINHQVVSYYNTLWKLCHFTFELFTLLHDYDVFEFSESIFNTGRKSISTRSFIQHYWDFLNVNRYLHLGLLMPREQDYIMPYEDLISQGNTGFRDRDTRNSCLKILLARCLELMKYGLCAIDIKVYDSQTLALPDVEEKIIQDITFKYGSNYASLWCDVFYEAKFFTQIIRNKRITIVGDWESHKRYLGYKDFSDRIEEALANRQYQALCTIDRISSFTYKVLDCVCYNLVNIPCRK